MSYKHAAVATLFSLSASFPLTASADLWDVLDPIGIGKAAKDAVTPPDFTIAPSPVPAQAEAPCNGAVVSPDGYGNTNFRFGEKSPTGVKYRVEFSRNNGTTWENPGATNSEEAPGTFQVSLKNLLLISKSWQWRVVPEAAGSTNHSNACAFSIKPAELTVLPAPVIKAPTCGANFKSGPVQFQLAPAKGQFSDFKTEFQYKSNGRWVDSNVLEQIDQDKPGTRYGAVIPAEVLAKDRFNATAWRWRARIFAEHLPEIFRNTTEGAYTPWCEFSVGTDSTAAGKTPLKVGAALPAELPPAGDLGNPGSGFMVQYGTLPSGALPPKMHTPGGRSIAAPQLPASATRPAGVPNPSGNPGPNGRQSSRSLEATSPITPAPQAPVRGGSAITPASSVPGAALKPFRPTQPMIRP